jgi:hypothetical protein
MRREDEAPRDDEQYAKHACVPPAGAVTERDRSEPLFPV